MTSAIHARRFFTLRQRAGEQLAAARLWRDMALRCARAKAQAERDASSLMEAAIRAGAEYVAAQTRETERGHARRLAEVYAKTRPALRKRALEREIRKMRQETKTKAN